MEALAMAIKFATDAKLDLLTIDGSGGGTGMSPWNMMESWGVPSILLHAKAYEYASRLAAKGEKVVDLSFAGGFAKGSNIFKALAIGAPYAKMICMGRAMMIPGFLGANIEGVLYPKDVTLFAVTGISFRHQSKNTVLLLKKSLPATLMSKLRSVRMK